MNDTKPLEADILALTLAHGRKALSEAHDLARDDFVVPAHREIFSAALKLDGDDSPVNLSTAYFVLPEKGPGREAVNGLPPAGALSILPSLVRELKRARALERAGTIAGRVSALAAASGQTPASRLEEIGTLAEELIRLGATRTDERAYVELSGVSDAEGGRLEMAAFDDTEERNMIETGIAPLDEMLHVEQGDFVVVGGITSSGKSSLCGQIAVTMAQKATPVVFVTSEMTHRQMLARFASVVTGIPVLSFLRSKTAIEIGAPLIYRTVGQLPIYFQRAFPPRMRDASAAIRTVAMKYGAKIAIIDYAQRLSDPSIEFQEQAVAQIAEQSKNLAMELGIVVVAAAQLNRQPSGRKDPRPLLSDLRGSGRLEQDANHVLFVHRPQQYDQHGSPEIIIAKQRNGPQAIVPVVFEAESCFFRSAKKDAA